jgi:5-hydroxyisourate hydrolase-like protein (transthyretin family)
LQKEGADLNTTRLTLITLLRGTTVAAALGALLTLTAPLSAQEIRGRTLDEESGRPVADVRVTLLDASGRTAASALTDTAGAFRLVPGSAGRYTLSFEHIAYAPFRSEEIRLHTVERVTLEVRLARTVYTMDPLTVTARGRRHDPTYEGLYARIPRSPRVGHDRIVVKGDVELLSAFTVRDVIERFFFRVSRRGGVCLYWNGHLQPSMMTGMWLDTSVDELEALEVYLNYLSAPISMWGPPSGSLATRCSAIIALWAFRPDLPGREAPPTQ